MDKILKVTKKLKTFTLEDIVMFSGIDTNSVREFLQQSENIKQVGNKFEYLEIIKVEDICEFSHKTAFKKPTNSKGNVIMSGISLHLLSIFEEKPSKNNMIYNDIKG